MDVVRSLEAIETRKDLARYVLLLRESLLTDADGWENATLERFLEALSSWISDMEGYFKNRGVAEPDQLDWHLVGQMLYAASIYE